jgi:RimJ/RimL family protein N-acetyltransferase
MNSGPAHPPPSLTGHVRLREVIEADLPCLFEHQREPEANQMAAFPARDREAFMAHWTKILADRRVTVRAILVDEEVAGNVVSWEQNGERLVGYWTGKEHWGKGIATQALGLFLRVVQERPLHAYVAKHNAASIRVLEKCGFTMGEAEAEAADTPGDGVEECVLKLGASVAKVASLCDAIGSFKQV